MRKKVSAHADDQLKESGADSVDYLDYASNADAASSSASRRFGAHQLEQDGGAQGRQTGPQLKYPDRSRKKGTAAKDVDSKEENSTESHDEKSTTPADNGQTSDWTSTTTKAAKNAKTAVKESTESDRKPTNSEGAKSQKGDDDQDDAKTDTSRSHEEAEERSRSRTKNGTSETEEEAFGQGGGLKAFIDGFELVRGIDFFFFVA